jgi:NADP-dependent 3-hydroxy acid dehydrogenase YdfG
VNLELSGKVVLIVGASAGIGASVYSFPPIALSDSRRLGRAGRTTSFLTWKTQSAPIVKMKRASTP